MSLEQSVEALRYLGLFSNLDASSVMSSAVHALHPEDRVAAARIFMREKSISGVPIVDADSRLVGLISVSKIIEALADEWKRCQAPMRTIAEHILDIASNSVTAGATRIWLDIDHDRANHLFVFTVRDDGHGMDADGRTRVFDPFFTTRPHSIRRFGLGLPFLKENVELTGGGVDLWSVSGEGTTLRATFHTDHIDCLPFGDLASTILALLISDGALRWHIRHAEGNLAYAVGTEEPQVVFSSEEMCDPRAQLLVLEFLRGQERDVVQGDGRESEQDRM
jgi:CBS domain-containing protein